MTETTYYTPTSIDEFIEGMQFEVNYPMATDGKNTNFVDMWSSDSYPNNADTLYHWFSVKQRFPDTDLTKVIRVKRLDRLDLRQSHFIISNEHGDDIISADYKNIKEEIFFMVYDFNTQEAVISIGKRLDCGCPNTVFRGTIKNINELKTILKQTQ